MMYNANDNSMMYKRIIHIDNYLNVNGLYTPAKRHRLTGWMKTCARVHFHLPDHSAWPPPPPHCM